MSVVVTAGKPVSVLLSRQLSLTFINKGITKNAFIKF